MQVKARWFVFMNVFTFKYVWVCLCTQSTVCLPVTQVCVRTAGIYITNSMTDLSWDPCETLKPLLLWNNGGCIYLKIDDILQILHNYIDLPFHVIS